MYYVLEPIIAQSFTSRVIALFYKTMERKGLLSRDWIIMEKIKGPKDHITKLTLSQYMELLKDVRLSAFASEA